MKHEDYDEYYEDDDERRSFRERLSDKWADITDWWNGVSPERRSFVRFLLIFVGVLAACVVVFFLFFFKGAPIDEESTQQTDGSSFESASSSVDEQSNEEKYKDSLYGLSEDTYKQLGLDGERIARDSQIIEEFSKVAFTFSNAEEYATARSQLAADYKGFNGSQFANEFMLDSDRDIKSSLAFRSVNCYATLGDGDIYSYICDVYVVVTASNGGSLEGDVVLCCDTNAKGELSNIQAYSAMNL